MEFKFNFERKYFLMIFLILAVVVIAGVGYSYGGNQPAVMGHSYQEIEGLPNPSSICTSSNSGDGNCADAAGSGGISEVYGSSGIEVTTSGTARYVKVLDCNQGQTLAFGSNGIWTCGPGVIWSGSGISVSSTEVGTYVNVMSCAQGQTLIAGANGAWSCGTAGGGIQCERQEGSCSTSSCGKTVSCTTGKAVGGGAICTGGSIEQSYPISGGTGNPPTGWYGECIGSTQTAVYAVCCTGIS